VPTPAIASTPHCSQGVLIPVNYARRVEYRGCHTKGSLATIRKRIRVRIRKKEKENTKMEGDARIFAYY
jgi:hypothetical protein